MNTTPPKRGDMSEIQNLKDWMTRGNGYGPFVKLHEEIIILEQQNAVMKNVLEMVEDNSKMPHQHTDLQTRLYCLAERG